MMLALTAGGLTYYDHLRKMERRAKQAQSAPPLHQAIAVGKLSVARKLLEGGSDPNEQSPSGNRALHWAESASAVELLLKHSADVNAMNDEGETPIFTVGNRGALAALIEAGADVMHRDRTGETPMHDAKNIAAARLFAGRGGKFKTKDKFGNPPLHAAQHVKIAKFILDSGADLHEVNLKGETALFRARNPEIAEFLISAGLSPKQVANGGKQPIHTIRSAETIRLLVKHGCDVNAQDQFGKTPLMFAKRPKAVATLLELGADVNITNTFGQSALSFAFDRPEIAKQLVEAGASISVASHYRGQSLISEAVWRDRVEFIKALESGGADFSGLMIPLTGDIDLIRQLMAAGAEPDFSRQHFVSVKRVDELVAAGVDVSAPDPNGRTALFQAMKVDVFDRLLELGADPTAVDHDGRSALGAMTKMRNVEIVDRILQCNAEAADLGAIIGDSHICHIPMLLDYGAIPSNDLALRRVLYYQPNHIDLIQRLLDTGPDLQANPTSPFAFNLDRLPCKVIQLLLQHGNELPFDGHNAYVLTKCRNVDLAKILIEAGAPLDAKSLYGNAAVHTLWDSPPLLEVVLDAGADPNATDKAGNTAMHRVLQSGRPGYPISQGRKTAITMLIEAGADPDIPNLDGKSPRNLLSKSLHGLLDRRS